MYIVEIRNGNEKISIHNTKEKLTSGKITKGINTIDSFQFSMLPSNIGFNEINDYTTLVSVYNTNRNRYDFYGRVLKSDDEMSESGAISKDVICESYFGFLCDSMQEYVAEKNWTVGGLFQHIINCHNSQMESYKQFTLGEVTVTDPNDNIYCGIQWENTWTALKNKLLDVLGGELRFRVDGDIIYIDYLASIGKVSETEIALSKNMKSITREKDPSQIITRLIPLGYKIQDTEGNETETRLDISSVNGGKKYIDDKTAIEQYGIRVGIVEFDDVTVASTLLTKGEQWLEKNNKIQVNYSVTALELSLLGLDIDDFDVYNFHPLKNPLLGINDTVRIIKKNIDICEEIKSTVEFGDNFETLSGALKKKSDALNLITSNYVTNQRFSSVINKTSTLIEQTEEKIRLEVDALYTDVNGFQKQTKAELALKIDKEDDGTIISLIKAYADKFELTAGKLIIDSKNFKVSANGHITASAGNIGDMAINSNGVIRTQQTTYNTFKPPFGNSVTTTYTRITDISKSGIYHTLKAETNSQSIEQGVGLDDGVIVWNRSEAPSNDFYLLGYVNVEGTPTHAITLLHSDNPTIFIMPYETWKNM